MTNGIPKCLFMDFYQKNVKIARMFFLGMACSLLTCFETYACFLPNYRHTQTVYNMTGKTATDLSIDLLYKGWDGTATGMLTVNGVGKTMYFDYGNVPNTGSVEVRWTSTFRDAEIVDPSKWTSAGKTIGAITTHTVFFDYVFDPLTSYADIFAVNPSSYNLSVVDLDLVANANLNYYTTDPINGFDSDSAFATGSSILSDYTGTLLPGNNLLVDDFLVNPFDGYFAGRVSYYNPEIDIDCYSAHGATAVPEPVSLTLGLLGLGTAVSVLRRRKDITLS